MCGVEQIQETRSFAGEGRGVGEQGVQRQSVPLHPNPVQELPCLHRAPFQHSGAGSDPALSLIVVPEEAAGGLLEQGGEYSLQGWF